MMCRTLRVIIAFALMFGAVTAFAIYPDHLLPVDTSRDRGYRTIIHRRLEKTPFDCGRVVIRPFIAYRETCMSLYHKRVNGTDRFFLNCVTAQDSLWDASDMGRLAWRAALIPTHREDVPVSRALATRVRAAFTYMLANTRELASNETPKTVIIEGTITEFSLPTEHGVRRGEISSIPLGPKVARFESIGKKLQDYCKAPPADRARLEAQIIRDATIFAAATNLNAKGDR